MRDILVVLLLSLLVRGVYASEIDDVLGMTPGEVSNIRGSSAGGPFEILRIPTKDKALSEIYPDLEVMISPESRKVVGVGSRRAYPDAALCKKAQDEVRAILKRLFPNGYDGKDHRWQYQSKDLGINAGAVCEVSSPYPVLVLDVTHAATNNELMMKNLLKQ